MHLEIIQKIVGFLVLASVASRGETIQITACHSHCRHCAGREHCELARPWICSQKTIIFLLTIAGSQWRQAQILSRWLVGANGHGDLLREPLRPPYRRHFRSSVDLAAHRSRAPHLNRCILKGWTLDLIGTG